MMNKEKLESKRDVLEYLWEWAEEKGTWAKLLLHEVSNTSESLSPDKLNTVYRYFRKNIGLAENIDEVTIQKPTIAFSGKSLKIKNLSKITGLNRLSSDSVIEFSPNLTVIYGENGTGKSGFSRILKDIGYSYEAETKLIPNIYSDENQDMSAEIEYICDDKSNMFTWKPGVKKDELKDISVYNSSCVAISLSNNRNLIVTPLGFSLFDRVSVELGALTTLLENEKSTLVTYYDWFESFHEGTIYNETIHKLQILTPEETEKISVFTPDDQKKLAELEKTYVSTTKELIEKEINELKIQNSELLEIKQKIGSSKLTFCKTQWDELLETSKDINNLKEKGFGSLEELTNAKGIALYGKVEFENFIKAADAYISSMPDGISYPDDKDARCIYCNQLLTDITSIDLLKKYKVLLKDTTKQALEKQEEKFTSLKNIFRNIPSNIQLYYSSYDQDEEQKPIQPDYLEAYNASVEKLKLHIETNNLDNVLFGIDYDSATNSLQHRIDEIDILLVKKNEILIDIEAEKSRLINEINLLKDKQLFTSKKSDVLNIINNRLLKETLEKNETAFNTAPVSAKTSKARKELVEQSFAEVFFKELSNLRKSHIKIELNFETKKGGTNINQRLQKRYNLSDILSEGEQKAISGGIFC